MLIDWFTVGAQLVNFIILIWLLKRFLYQPILAALNAREAKIAAELANANAKQLQAEAERNEFIAKNQEFEQQRAELFAMVTEEVKIERQHLLDEARQDAENLRLKQHSALQSEQKSLIAAIRHRTQTEVLAIARQALQDLAGVSLESQMVAVFIEKLQQLTESEKQSVIQAAKNTALPLLVRTAFDLSPHHQAEITQAVKNTFAIESELQFTTSEHLISGIELSSDGHKFSWSVAHYLAKLEKNFDKAMQVVELRVNNDDNA